MQPSWRRSLMQSLCASMGAASPSPFNKMSNHRRQRGRRSSSRPKTMGKAPRRRCATARRPGTGALRPEGLASLRPRTIQQWTLPSPTWSRRPPRLQRWPSTMAHRRRWLPQRTRWDPPQARRPRAHSRPHCRAFPMSMQPLGVGPWIRELNQVLEHRTHASHRNPHLPDPLWQRHLPGPGARAPSRKLPRMPGWLVLALDWLTPCMRETPKGPGSSSVRLMLG